MQHFLNDVVLRFGYIGIFVLMAGESAALPIPSEVVMPLAGALCSSAFVAHLGAQSEGLNFWLVGLVGTGANLVGSCTAYLVARTGGRKLVRRIERTRFLEAGRLEQAERWFEKRGNVAVLIGRVVPVVRTFVSVPAGAARMPFGPFVLYTVIGSLPWNFALAGLGLLLGTQWVKVSSAVKWISVGVVAAIAIGVVAWWLVRRRRKARFTR